MNHRGRPRPRRRWPGAAPQRRLFDFFFGFGRDRAAFTRGAGRFRLAGRAFAFRAAGFRDGRLADGREALRAGAAPGRIAGTRWRPVAAGVAGR